MTLDHECAYCGTLVEVVTRSCPSCAGHRYRALRPGPLPDTELIDITTIDDVFHVYLDLRNGREIRGERREEEFGDE